MASDVVWWPAGQEASRQSAAALIVSYNTQELTALLLWSLRTIVNWPDLEVVVVDNGSRDGSAQLLAEAGRGGVCTLLANRGNRHHGPGLNQGISYLARRPGPRPAWIWIPDSDVVATRPDALSAAAAARAVALRRALRAVLAADGPSRSLAAADRAFQRRRRPVARPARHGGVTRHPDGALPIHRRRPRHPPRARQPRRHEPHFAGVPGADQQYHTLLQEFRKQTAPLTGATLAAACRRAPGLE